MVRITSWLALLWLASCLGAGDAVLVLPEPLVRGSQVDAELRYSGNDSLSGLDLPTVSGLTWGQPHSQLSQLSIINGARSQTVTVQIPLRLDREPGPVQIPAFDLRLASGATTRVEAVSATVVAPDTTVVSGDGLAEASVEPSIIVPGQPCTIVLRVWCRAGQTIEPGLSPPSEALSLGKRTQASTVITTSDGVAWHVTTFRWPVTMSEPGTFTLGGQQSILVATGRSDIFGRVEGRPRQLPIRPATLTVVALPSVGRPADFTGVIGAITAEASLDRTHIRVGEGVRLTLRVRGPQQDVLRAPTLTGISATQGLHSYARAAEAIDGGKAFHWDIVPNGPGIFTLPPFSFAWFDPQTRSYRRSEAPVPTLTVVPGLSRELTVGGAPAAPSTSDAHASPRALTLPLPLRDTALAIPPAHWLLWMWACGIFAGMAVAFALRARKALTPRQHRGAALQRSIASGDATAIAAALAAFDGVTLDNDAQRAALAQMRAAIDQHRFGGVAVPDDLAAHAARVAEVP